jgi:hypothetical protein
MRAALPPAAVPFDFAERVTASVVEPPSDAPIVEAARPRRARWIPVGVAVVAACVAAWWPRGPSPAVTGDLRVAADGGAWSPATDAAPGRTFGLEPGGRARIDGVTIDARARAVLRAADPLELIGGRVVLTAGAQPAEIETALATIRLRAFSACEASLDGDTEDEDKEERTMDFETIRRWSPRALAVTLLAGTLQVAHAQGAETVDEPGKRVDVGEFPAQPVDELARRIADAKREIEAANRRIAELRAELDRTDTLRAVLGTVVEAGQLEAALVRANGIDPVAADPAKLPLNRLLAAHVDLHASEATVGELVKQIAAAADVRIEVDLPLQARRVAANLVAARAWDALQLVTSEAGGVLAVRPDHVEVVVPRARMPGFGLTPREREALDGAIRAWQPAGVPDDEALDVLFRLLQQRKELEARMDGGEETARDLADVKAAIAVWFAKQADVNASKKKGAR